MCKRRDLFVGELVGQVAPGGSAGPICTWDTTEYTEALLRNSNWRARVFGPAVALCRKADDTFPTITPHDLRHTAASLAISAGANVKAVQRMLGHAKASMTLDVYADLFDTDLDAVAAELDAAIKAVAVRG
jgi:integrase